MPLPKSFLTALLISCVPVLAFSQSQEPVCGTQRHYEAAKEAHPFLEKAEQKADQFVKEQLANRAKQNGHRAFIIPVVVHVLHDDGLGKLAESQVREAIERMNTDLQLENRDTARVRDVFKDRMGDFNYELRLVKQSPDGSCTSGITFTDTDLTNGDLYLNNLTQYTPTVPYWNPDEYLNIWIAREIFVRGNDRVIAGQANFPWDGTGADGIIVRSDQVAPDDRTLTHEIGHYVGLRHPFQGGCNGRESVGDTPPVAQRDGIIECNFNLNTCGGQFPDMVENYMDYTECGIMFTQGQKNRANRFLADPFRGELVSDSNLAKVGIRVTDAPPKITTVTPDKSYFYTCEEVNYKFTYDQQCSSGELQYGTPTDLEWQFQGGKPQTSGSDNPVVSYDEPGTYEVSLKVSNASGSDEVVKTRFVEVLGSDAILEPPFLRGFENPDVDESGVIRFRNKNGPEWKRSTEYALNGNASLALDNFNAGDDQLASFRLPRMNLSGLDGPRLKFDIAFATIEANPDDLLEIYYSLDCGRTWEKRSELYPFLLQANDNNVTEPFFPSGPSDWKTKDVRLPSGQNVLVRFDWNTSSGGNNVFIDNIRLNYNVGLSGSQETSRKALTVYPNPTTGAINLKNTGSLLEGRLQVVNNMGQVVYQQADFQLPEGGNVALSAEQLNLQSKGLYHLQLITAEKTITQRIVLVK